MAKQKRLDKISSEAYKNVIYAFLRIMMQDLTAAYFFDLNHYQHASIFSSQDPVWKALDSLETYLKSLPLGKIEVDIPDGAFLVDPHLISIGKGTVIEPGTYIKGPCYIGENCSVRHGAYIRGNLLAGNRCVIGHTTEVKNVIMLDHALAGHFAYLGDSILGNDVNLGAGTKFANLKLDHQAIEISIGTARIRTGMRKLGAVLGDGCQTGCNSVSNPGTLCGKYVVCYPNVNMGGFIPSRSVVKNGERPIITTQTN